MPQVTEGSGPRFSGEGRPQMIDGSSEGRPQMIDGGAVQLPNDGSTRLYTAGPQDGQSQAATPAIGEDGLPVGFQYVVVTTGASDDNYIEITSGLSEGDEIAYIPDTPGQDMFMTGMTVGFGPGIGQQSSGPVPGGTVVRRPID